MFTRKPIPWNKIYLFVYSFSINRSCRIRDDIEKEDAFRGLCAMVRVLYFHMPMVFLKLLFFLLLDLTKVVSTGFRLEQIQLGL